ncbi:uncharacterized protein LOC108665852 [Hyalella azteca]|uniref:Uncharacterized protein LOC108665852 n=1 Tax=Hyalella azteca TaxID=294128 RepID=A0A8B7N4G0_HYAAZ|nr:uncharacterized protein LOC108665852 [Hyalella azteca]
MTNSRNLFISDKFQFCDNSCLVPPSAEANAVSEKLEPFQMSSHGLSLSQYIRKFTVISSIFSVKSVRKTRLFVGTRTCLVVVLVICMCWSLENVDGFVLSPVEPAALVASRALKGAPKCVGGARHGRVRGDVGALLNHHNQGLASGYQEPVKDRKKRYLAFPDDSTLTFKVAFSIPVGSMYNGNKLLEKYIEYAFIIQLPTEKLIFTGLHDVFHYPGKAKGPHDKGYGTPRPETVLLHGSEGATYGRPNSHTRIIADYGKPDEQKQDSGTSSYSKLQKDLLGSTLSDYELQVNSLLHPDLTSLSENATQLHEYHAATFHESDLGLLPENITLSHNEYEEDLDDWMQPHGSQQNLHDVIMSPLDHQRLLGFKSIEKTFDGAGLPGRWCLLKAVCAVAAEPLSEFGLLGEMLNLFLAAGYGDGSPALVEYMIAEEIGYMDGSCDRHFQACPVDLVDLLASGASVLGGGLSSAAA